MSALIFSLLRIMTLRKGPQSLPAYWSVLVVALVLWVLAIGVSALIIEDTGTVFSRGILTLLLSASFSYMLLTVYNQQHRVVQTLSAVIGCGALISLLISPLVWLIGPQVEQTNAALGSLVFLAVIWSVVVDGHILRHALSTHHFAGAILAIAMFVISQVGTAMILGNGQ